MSIPKYFVWDYRGQIEVGSGYKSLLPRSTIIGRNV
jgi:hypothetical protein